MISVIARSFSDSARLVGSAGTALAAAGSFEWAYEFLLVVDDAQWLDRSSAEVLAFVARRMKHETIGMPPTSQDGVESFNDGTALRSSHQQRTLHATYSCPASLTTLSN